MKQNYDAATDVSITPADAERRASRDWARACNLAAGDALAGASRVAVELVDGGEHPDEATLRLAHLRLHHARFYEKREMQIEDATAWADAIVARELRIRERRADGAARVEEADGEIEVAPAWSALQSLPAALPAVPALDVELLPAAWRAWVEDSSERLQVPPEMIATPAIVAAGAVIGRRIAVTPKRYDDWWEVPNLWGAVVGRPGTLKSPAVTEGMRHIRRLAAQAREAHKKGELVNRLERKSVALAIRRAEGRGSSMKGDPREAAEEIVELTARAAELSTPERRYLTQDATIEKLGELLVENPRGLLVLRDELFGWLATFDRAGREGEREFFLEAWSARDSYTCDRIGRGTVHIPTPCLAVFGTIQPGKLRSLISSAVAEGVGDDGLLQRFQLIAWPDVPTEWVNHDRYPHSGARRQASESFDYLDQLDAGAVGASSEHCPVTALRFDEDAQELFDAWRSELEHRLRGEELVGAASYEAHVSKYRKLMPALALILHLADAGRGAITLDAARRAADLVDFYDLHARRVYAVELQPDIAAARALADRIERGHVADGTSIRDVKERNWSGLSSSQLVEDAVENLAARGWLFVEERDTGGRQTRVLYVRPGLARVASWGR